MRTGAKIFTLSMLFVLFCVSLSLARDTRHMFSIKQALEQPEAKAKLNQGVRFYFGDQAHPEPLQRFGTFTSNRKTNAFGKSDLEACEWAFLGALIALQERALREGGDAVINIKSYYQKHEISSADQYECGAGNVIAGVALRGSVVKLGKIPEKKREDAYYLHYGAPVVNSIEQLPLFRSNLPCGELPVTPEGPVPADLRGRLIRVAPVGFSCGSWKAEHWFDGLGMLYAFDVGERLRFRSEWLDSCFRAQCRKGRVSMGSFGTRRNPTFWDWLLHPIGDQTDNCNVNVARHGNYYLALTETNRTVAFDADTLRTKQRFEYTGDIPERATNLAHPRYHQTRRQLISLCTNFGRTTEVHVAGMKAGSGSRMRLNSWKTPRWPYLHDFGLTEHHAVILAHPYSVQAWRMLWSTRGLAHHIEVRPDDAMRLVVLSLDGEEPVTLETEPSFVYHLFNSFEDHGEIVMDVVAHSGSDAIDKFYVANIERSVPCHGGTPIRLRLDLSKRRVRREPITDDICEFPQINHRQAHMRPYRYGYATRIAVVDADGQEHYGGEVVKIDMQSNASRAFHEPDWVPGEPVFVPATAGRGREDDGYILSVASHRVEEKAQLWILDATDMQLMSRLTVDAFIPLGFHGQFFAV